MMFKNVAVVTVLTWSNTVLPLLLLPVLLPHNAATFKTSVATDDYSDRPNSNSPKTRLYPMGTTFQRGARFVTG
jgi:hypothetical protein